MFVGWFKIEGHSNPKSRKGFLKQNKIQKDRQRLGNDKIVHIQSDYSDEHRRFYKTWKHIIKVVAAFFLLASFILMIAIQFQTENGVIDEMTKQQVEVNGTDEFISKVDFSIRAARKSYRSGDYEQAYFWYKEAYQHGTTKEEVYISLYKVGTKLCKTDETHCDEIQKWEDIIGRLGLDVNP